MRSRSIHFSILALSCSISLFATIFSERALAADDMTVFLRSSGYGAAAGAILGLASLAISDNPDSKINNVARGASLGLYAGIGFGLYSINSRTAPLQRLDEASNFPQIWMSPIFHLSQLEGAQVSWMKIAF